MTPPLDPFSCPVCKNCDHDLRSGILDLTTNIMENFKAAAGKLIDGMEADTDGAAEFSEALFELASVRAQVTALIATIPDIAILKAANSE